MRRARHGLLVIVPFTTLILAGPQRSPWAADFRFACEHISSSYAYFDVKATRWSDVPGLYENDLANVHDKREFVMLMERVVEELYDSHAQLTTNTASSPRLVPSGTDLWAEWHGDSAMITDVRHDSDAERAGIRAGAVVIALDGVPIENAVRRRMGRSYPKTDSGARDWALRAVLAGHHDTRRRLELADGGAVRDVTLPARDQFQDGTREAVTLATLPDGTGYVRLNDSLGRSGTVAMFDRALATMANAPALVLDLRDTPSGGNTTVARGILGRFVDHEAPYQKHVLPAEERESGIRRSWLELVSPRAPIFHKPVAVLVGHWTGSMGEGLAIGFDATRAGRVVGTAMAGLLGATYTITLPNTGIGINLPAERLYHVNGTPREAFRPPFPVETTTSSPEDAVLARALEILTRRPPSG